MTTTQVAVLMPALLFWIMLIVQFGLWYHAKQVADAAAAEAVDAAQAPGATEADGHAAALVVLDAAGNLGAPEVAVERGLESVTATVRGASPRLVPGFSWSVTGHAEAPVERFIPEHER